MRRYRINFYDTLETGPFCTLTLTPEITFEQLKHLIDTFLPERISIVKERGC